MIKSNLNSECGKRLKECLKNCSMTQGELADLTGYTQQYISNIVTGKKPMTIATATHFAEYLNVSEEYLLCESSFKDFFEEIDFAECICNTQDNTLMKLLNLLGYKIKFESSTLKFNNNSYTDKIVVDYENASISVENVKVKINNEEPVNLTIFMDFLDEIYSYIRFSIENLPIKQIRCDNKTAQDYEEQRRGQLLVKSELSLPKL